MRNNIFLRFTALFSLTPLYSHSPAHPASAALSIESYLTHLAGEEVRLCTASASVHRVKGRYIIWRRANMMQEFQSPLRAVN